MLAIYMSLMVVEWEKVDILIDRRRGNNSLIICKVLAQIPNEYRRVWFPDDWRINAGKQSKRIYIYMI